MKLSLILISIFLALCAADEEVDWSRVRPIKQFSEFWLMQGLEPPASLTESHPNFVPKIVGGQNARPNQFPYQVGLISRMAEGDGLCGGTPISARTVLTAAHCLSMLSLAESTLVILGAHNLTDANEPNQVRVRVPNTQYIIHAGWDPTSSLQNDIALIIMPQAITFNQFVQQVVLPSGPLATDDFVGELATLSGWGIDSDATRTPSQILNYVTLPVISNRRCSILFPILVRENNICVSGAAGQGGCQGDSGGPLTIQRNGQSVQIGIASFAMGLACESVWPTGFSRVTFFLDWIQENMV